MNTRIIHLTTVHTAFDTRIFHKECKTLLQITDNVILITTYIEDSVVDGISIRAINKPNSRLQRITINLWMAYKRAIKEAGDIYHFHDPELIILGLLLKMRGKIVIYDVHEDFPRQILSKHWIPVKLRKLISKTSDFIEIFSSRFFDGIIAATSTIANRFDHPNTIVLYNFPQLKDFSFDDFIPYNKKANNIIYIGTLDISRGMKEIISAMSLVDFKTNSKLILAGKCSSNILQQELVILSLSTNIEYIGWQDLNSVKRILNNAKIGLVILYPTPSYIHSYPVKLFEYMAAGIPVIASNFPLWKNIIDQAQCGILVNPLDPTEIANAIQWLLKHPLEAEAMGCRGRQAVLNHYNWGAEGDKLIAFYENLINISKRSI